MELRCANFDHQPRDFLLITVNVIRCTFSRQTNYFRQDMDGPFRFQVR